MDRSMCTACTNAAQKRTLDIAQAVPRATPAMFRTASSAKLNGFPACGPVLGHRCCPCEQGIRVRTISEVSRHYPDIHAGDICDRTKRLLPIFRRESERNIVSRQRPEHKGARIVIR